MPDTLQKLDYLTMHLRGFDRRGAAAAFHSASATGAKIAAGAAVGGVFGGELGFVPADTPVSIDITQVGSGFPGENLVATVRF